MRAEYVHNQYRKVLDDLAAPEEKKKNLLQLLREARLRAGDICVAKGHVFLQVGVRVGVHLHVGNLSPGVWRDLSCEPLPACNLNLSMQDAAMCFYWAGEWVSFHFGIIIFQMPSML